MLGGGLERDHRAVAAFARGLVVGELLGLELAQAGGVTDRLNEMRSPRGGRQARRAVRGRAGCLVAHIEQMMSAGPDGKRPGGSRS